MLTKVKFRIENRKVKDEFMATKVNENVSNSEMLCYTL